MMVTAATSTPRFVEDFDSACAESNKQLEAGFANLSTTTTVEVDA